jgi:hypothetical protein
MIEARIADTPSLFRAHGQRTRRPKGAELAARLVDALDRRGGGWVSAGLLAADLGVDKRTIRAAANQSQGHVIGGQHGYCRTIRASLAEVQAVTRALLSQSARMRKRVIEIERVRHGQGER